ncbi:AAA family ATPase [Nakamurella antarctica]|nr:chromosome partitioning protein [Nakamurella antarctica]
MGGVLTAGSGQAWESELVAILDRPDSAMTVVRRCADITEVLASAATGRAHIAVLDSSLRKLDTEAISRLRLCAVAAVGVYPAGEESARARLLALGITALVADDAGVQNMIAVADEAVAELANHPESAVGQSDLRRSQPPISPEVAPAKAASGRGVGIVVAVWGPTGAPGRSTVAMGVADECALLGHRTLLIDADVYGGVLASAFGLLDESPGLAGACRMAANGRLDAAELIRHCWSVTPNLRLLTGISRADRWPELRPSALPKVLGLGSKMADLTVVDCGWSLEADEEISFDTMAPRRNGATLAVLSEADVVLVVGCADPTGMDRLVRALAELKEVAPQPQVMVVLNRIRKTGWSAGQASAALERFSGVRPLQSLPEDRAATDAGWNLGLALSVAAPSSGLRKALMSLALQVAAARSESVA